MVRSIFRIEILFFPFRFQKLYIFEHTTTVALKVKTMRKTIAMLSALILALIPLAMIGPAQAYPLSSFTWGPPHIMRGYFSDPYYDYIVAYENGSTANLLVPVWNDPAYGYTNGLNVSKVVLNFYEIGINKTLDYYASPHQIASNNYELFTVSFTADLTEFGVSTWDHVYRIIVEHVNATTGPKKLVSPSFTRYYSSVSPGYKFVVVSTAQVDAMDSLVTYNSYYSYYYYYSWQSIDAQQKASQAVIEKGIGDTYNQRGDYASATTQYNKANTLWEEALAAENEWRTTSQEASLNVTLTTAAANMKEADAALVEANAALITANATQTQADAALTNAYGWYFIGIGFAIGWTLIGIGVIIYALRKPKLPT